jgi:streptogramin lyase
MKIDLDLKSAALGAAACGLIILATAAADRPPTSIGRYQVAGGAGTFVILDTVTGKPWYYNMGSQITRNSEDFFTQKSDK